MTVTAHEWGWSGRSLLISGPTEEPLTVADANAHLRVDTYDDEITIEGLITTARIRVEQDTGRALITQTWDFYWDDVPPSSTLLLPKAPIQSVTSVTSYNDSDVAAVLAATNYRVDTVSEPGRITLTSSGAWPSDVRDTNAFVVRAVCGYGAAVTVPRPLTQAMLLLIGSLYEQREQVLITQFAGQFIEMPFGYRELISPYRLTWVC